MTNPLHGPALCRRCGWKHWSSHPCSTQPLAVRCNECGKDKIGCTYQEQMRSSACKQCIDKYWNMVQTNQATYNALEDFIKGGKE